MKLKTSKSPTNVAQPDKGAALSSSASLKPVGSASPATHPWRTFRNFGKLKAARHEARKRRAFKYRNEHIEERRQLERHWHRKKLGLPLEAPKMKPWDHVKASMPNASAEARRERTPNGSKERY